MTQLTNIKAIIRYNQLDGKSVAYYQQGDRFFKMVDSKRIRPMGKTILHTSNFVNSWSQKIKVQVVYDDEQLLFNGSPVGIEMDVFKANLKALNV